MPTASYQPKPSVVSRSTWGAQPANSNGTTRTSTGKIVFHHCATANSTVSTMSEYDLMKAIQNDHLNRPNYSDIAYHFAIGKNGTILEGRREAARSYASNSNPTDFDKDAIHIMVMGNYNERTMTSAQKQSLEDLMAWICYKYDASSTNVLGHRDNPASTSNYCPGSFNYIILPDFRHDLALRLYGFVID